MEDDGRKIKFSYTLLTSLPMHHLPQVAPEREEEMEDTEDEIWVLVRETTPILLLGRGGLGSRRSSSYFGFWVAAAVWWWVVVPSAQRADHE